MGRLLIIAGVILVTIGILIVCKVPFTWLSKVPGNFSGKWGNVTFYFPLGICIALSIILSLLSWAFRR